jgi:16S rRNA (uracil1498-N3)-methyltransferase
MDALNNYQEDILILIGPEGDFSRDEVELALANKFQPVSLGECRLRTETAGLVALHIMNLNNRTYRDATLN